MRTRKSKRGGSPEQQESALVNKLAFQREVNRLREGGLTMLEAIQEYCEIHAIEADSIPKMLTPAMLDHLHSEAKQFNLVKRTNTVDI